MSVRSNIKDSIALTSVNAIPTIRINKRLYTVVESYENSTFKLECQKIAKKPEIIWSISIDSNGYFKTYVATDDKVLDEMFNFWFNQESDGYITLNSWTNWVNKNLASVHSLVVMIMYRDYVKTDINTASSTSRSRMNKLEASDITNAYIVASKMLDKSIVNSPKFPIHVRNLLNPATDNTEVKVESKNVDDKLAQCNDVTLIVIAEELKIDITGKDRSEIIAAIKTKDTYEGYIDDKLEIQSRVSAEKTEVKPDNTEVVESEVKKDSEPKSDNGKTETVKKKLTVK